MSETYYAVILLYPLIAALIARTTVGGGLWRLFKSCYYLLGGIIVAYAGVTLFLLSFLTISVSLFLNFILFSMMYFIIFFLRTYVFTQSHDLFAALPGSRPK